MRKTIAAISASILGVSGAVIAAAAPAGAAEPACAEWTDVTVSANANTQPLYTDCIPQYGVGKAEFTVTSTDTFPAGYSLADGEQTVTSTVSAPAIDSYFDSISDEGYWIDIEAPTASTGLEQDYFANEQYMTVPISSFAPISVSDLPADCTPSGETYAHAYEVQYAPESTTFKQTINGKVWTVTTTYTAAPLFLGLNFVASPGVGFDTTAAQCASAGGLTLQADNSAGPDYVAITQSEATYFDNEGVAAAFDPVPPAIDPVIDAGTFAASDPAVPPVLATTGVDPTEGVLLGSGLLAVGVLLGGIRFGTTRRRRTTGSRAG